jgi:Tol biopolymer transport system component
MMRRYIIYISTALIALWVFPPGLYGQAKGSFEVIHVSSVSSGSDDMAPVMMSDGILFCSNRKTNPFLTKKNLEGVRLYDLYFAPFNAEGDPAKPVRFAPDLAKDANIGPASFTPDGKTLYFTKNYKSGKGLKKKEENKLGIFTARRNGSQWTDIQPFEYNDAASNFSYPFISADGQYLFFCSDMPGGNGSYDIYMCEYTDGRWSKPVNLGSNVNTSDAEIHPFLHSTGRLYFASDRPGGMGGLVQACQA